MTLLVATRLAVWLRKSAILIITLIGITIAGYVLLMATTNRVALLSGATLIVAAVYPAIPLCIAWITSNNAGYTKRSTVNGMLQVLIQSFSIISTQIYTTPPRFLKGHGIVLGFLVLGFVSVIMVVWLMKRSNAAKDREAARWRERGEPNPDESKTLEDLCDNHPNYRYVW
jgi:MFS transporter, ACS family, DAL5 transporter family protein